MVARDVEIQLFESRLNNETGRKTVEQIDRLNGYEFEGFLRELFSKMGYSVHHTPLSGDQGADLVIEKYGEKIVVQAKCYSGTIGNFAVQEIVAACLFYGAHRGMVVTNSYFTPAAIELASANNVELIDRKRLAELIERNW
jgi:restriction system protein